MLYNNLFLVNLMKLLFLILISTPAVAERVNAHQFQGLNQLVGHCWQATFPDGKKVDTHCFSKVYDGAFIRDEHVVCGDKEPYYGETWYVKDANTGAITYRYYNSLGGVSDGSVESVGNELHFPNESYENKGQQIVYRTRWSLNKDEYQSNMWQQNQDKSWKKIWQMDFRKIDLKNQSIVQFDQQQQLYCR